MKLSSAKNLHNIKAKKTKRAYKRDCFVLSVSKAAHCSVNTIDMGKT